MHILHDFRRLLAVFCVIFTPFNNFYGVQKTKATKKVTKFGDLKYQKRLIALYFSWKRCYNWLNKKYKWGQLYAKEKNVEFIWLRGYYIVGNTEYGCSIFSKITEAVKEGKTEFPFTTGQSQYDFLDYDIFCEQVVKASVQNEELGIINCCSGYPQKLADVVEKFIAGMGYNIVLKYGVFPERAYDSKAVWGDDSKIKRIMSKGKNE